MALFAGAQPTWIQPQARRLSHLVNFNQTKSGPTTVARKNSGIVSWCDCYENGRFQVVRRRQACRLNSCLLSVFPISVAAHYITIFVLQRKFRICQNTGNAKLREGRSEPTHDDLSAAVASAGDKAANHHCLISFSSNETSG